MPPAPLPREIARVRLIEALRARFDVPIVCVVAGAGFGKSTALAQAIRSNLARPRGHDVWISCEVADEDAHRLATAIVTAIAPDRTVDDPVNSVVQALIECAPIDVCLVVDDLHELPDGSSGQRLLGELVERLPQHCHVVLASRCDVPFPLARRRAAGDVIDVSAHDLAFVPDEVVALAKLHADAPHDLTPLTELAGWPSLISLALAKGSGVAEEFLWEEVVARLSPSHRKVLMAMTTLGWGTAADLSVLCGTSVRAADVRRIVRSVPLIIARDGGTRFVVHQLWEAATPAIFADDDVAECRRRALRLIGDRGEVLRLGAAAIAWGDAPALAEAALGLVRNTFGALPIETAERWLGAAAECDRRRPELQLLRLAVRQARHVTGCEIDADLDAIIAACASRERGVGQAEAIALASVAAHARGDLGRLLGLAGRAAQLPDIDHVPLLRFLVDAIAAAMTSLRGDADETLALIDRLRFDEVSDDISELVTRLRVSMLLLAGRADEAVAHSERLVRSSDPHVRGLASFSRWQGGDPSDFVGRPLGLLDHGSMNERDLFTHAAEVAFVAAAVGDEASAAEAVEVIEAYGSGVALDPRDSAITAQLRAAVSVLDHDEEAARSALAAHVERWPLDDPLGELHLHRHLALGYVLSDEIRAHWEGADLGPTHRQVRAAARCLVAARVGALDSTAHLPPPGIVFTSFPLPWTVELAVAACARGVDGAHDLVRSLATWAASATRNELRELAGRAGELGCAAAALASDLPSPCGPQVRIDVLGPMRLSIDGRTIDRPELRRSRVRTLLALLAIRRQMRREQIIELLWPDIDIDRGRQNLRTTLSRLRRLIATPDEGPSTSRLRIDGEVIELCGPPIVDVDVWELRRLLDVAADGRAAAERLDALERAFGLWRGEPLADVEAVSGIEPDVELIRSELTENTLRLGELLLAAGRFDDALRCVERVRATSPYSERAHRLGLAVHLQVHDHRAVEASLRRLDDLFGDLGIEPESATSMVMARASEFIERTARPQRVARG